MALVGERRRGKQNMQLLDSSSGAQLHAYLAPDAFLAGKGFVNCTPNETGLAERAVPTPGGYIPGVQAVEDFTTARPLLETMGKKALHVGPMGQGSVLKLSANLVAASIVTAMNEGLVLAAKAGLDPALVAEVLAERSPLIGRAAPRVLAGQFTANFPLRLSHKDVSLALVTGRRLGVPLFGLAAVAQLQTAALAKGLGDLDQIATIQVLEEITGVQVRRAASVKT